MNFTLKKRRELEKIADRYWFFRYNRLKDVFRSDKIFVSYSSSYGLESRFPIYIDIVRRMKVHSR